MANPFPAPASALEPSSRAIFTDIVTTDTLGRAPVGHPNRLHLVHEESDGTLILEPAVVVTEREYADRTRTSDRTGSEARFDEVVTLDSANQVSADND